MAFSDEELAKRLRNRAADYSLADDAVNAKWLYEASARLMELGGLITSWHPSLTQIKTNTEAEMAQVIQFIVKNPFEGDQSGF